MVSPSKGQTWNRLTSACTLAENGENVHNHPGILPFKEPGIIYLIQEQNGKKHHHSL